MCFRIFPGAASLVVFALLLVQTVWASHVETFSDSSCDTPLTDWFGPNNGQCTRIARNGNWSSFHILNLQRGCASAYIFFSLAVIARSTGYKLTNDLVTIYGYGTAAGICDSDAAPGAIVAQAGTCYNSTEWAFYSIDGCAKSNPITSSTSSSSTKTTLASSSRISTTSSSSTTQGSATSTPQPAHKSHTNIGAIVGGVIGGVAFGIIVGAICIVSFIRYRRAKRNRLPEYSGAPGSSHGLADMHAKELPGGALYHESRPGSARSAPGEPGGPQELSTEGIPEVPSYPIAELESQHGDTRPKSPSDGLKK